MINVRKMPPDVGVAGWNAILPERQACAELVGKHEADYLIIGAGFAGLAAARRLTQLEPDARIIILEGRKIAEGPAGRNSGFMIDLPHELASDDYAGNSADNDRRHTIMNRAAIEFAMHAADEYGLSKEAIFRGGKTNAAATEKGLKHNADYAQHLSQLGEQFKMLDASDMKHLTGTSYYQGGLWTPGTVMLQPALFCRGVAEGLQTHASLKLYEQSPVISMEKVAQGHWLAKTTNGAVSANKVILAVNGLLEHFGFLTKRFMHVMLYGSMTRPLTPAETNKLGGEPRWGLTPADPLGTTVRRISGTGGDRIIIRNRANYEPNCFVSPKQMASVAQTHEQSFKDRFPFLRDVGMDYCWSGRLCLSLNNVQVWGEIDEGLFSACCQNGLGAAKGTAGGIVAAEKAVGTEDVLIPEYLPEPDPKRLPPEPFMRLGANAVMRWKEYRAGKEF